MADITEQLAAPKKRKPTNVFRSENPNQPERPKRDKRSERRKVTENGIKALNPNGIVPKGPALDWAPAEPRELI